MPLQTELKELLLRFSGGEVAGAQMTVEESAVVDGVALRRQRTMGIDAGSHPEYAAKIEAVLGKALAASVKAVEAKQRELDAKQREIEDLEAGRGEGRMAMRG